MNAINVLPSLANKEHSRILQKHTPFPMLISLTIYHHSTNIIISLSEPSFLLFLHQDCANYHIKCIFCKLILQKRVDRATKRTMKSWPILA